MTLADLPLAGRLLRRLPSRPGSLRHATALLRLGERPQLGPAADLLPLGARAALRALRTRAAAQIRPDRVWPFWLERQLDPASEAFIPPGELPLASNVTSRNWTGLGNPGAEREAIVDPRGLLTPRYDGWSIDWAVGSADGWRLASREAGVRQRALGGPIVRTVLPVSGGALSHTAYAVGAGGDEAVVVELTNESDERLELILAVRPYNPEGLAVVERIELAGQTIVVDGTAAVVLDEPPLDWTTGTFAGSDSLHVLTGEADPEATEAQASDPAGLASGAALHTLEPGAGVRAALPLAPRRPSAGRIEVRELEGPEGAVARWAGELRRGLRVLLPDRRLQEAVDANRAYLRMLADGDEVTAGPHTYHRFWFRDAAYELAALDRWGFHDEAARVLRSYGRRQRRNGRFESQRCEWDSNGAALWAIAEHRRLTGDLELTRSLGDAIAAGAAGSRRSGASAARARPAWRD